MLALLDAASCAITVGLAICSPTSALMAVLGSVLGTATGLLMQAPLEAGIYAGLWGYNAVLGCMAIGGMFFYPTKSAFVLASLWAQPLCLSLRRRPSSAPQSARHNTPPTSSAASRVISLPASTTPTHGAEQL